jgi:hypothetical protein
MKRVLTPSRCFVLIVAFAWSICAREAFAHAVLFEAIPAPNAIVSGHSVAIRLRFNVRVDAGRSRLALVNPDGSLHSIQVKPQQPADVVAADVFDLGPGHYDLKWQVLASDGHITQGDIPFAVK